MYSFSYITRITTKDHLFVCINGSTFDEVFKEFCKLIPECVSVTYVKKFF